MIPASLFAEDDLLPLSGLQHLAFCERQWALIHLERAWSENHLTAEGRVLHERVGVITARGLPLRSLRIGISGQADAVEFYRSSLGATLPGRAGTWLPIPVEYKRGRKKPGDCDQIQLCAQALCLEEMFAIEVPQGALFYATPRRRTAVEFTAALRSRTEMLCARMQTLHRLKATPAPIYTKGCESCSLTEGCLPKALAARPSVAQYLSQAFLEI